jgi:hypothetical protein
MANYMAEVAKMLGVEMNEEFKCEGSNCTYKITEQGLWCNGFYGADSLMMILKGTLQIKHGPWKPKKDNFYWNVRPNGELSLIRWLDDITDLNNYKLGNCYKTKEEANRNYAKWIVFYASNEVLEV